MNIKQNEHEHVWAYYIGRDLRICKSPFPLPFLKDCGRVEHFNGKRWVGIKPNKPKES